MSRIKTVRLYGGVANKHGDTHKVLGNNINTILSSLYRRNTALRHDIKSQNWHIYIGEMTPDNSVCSDDLGKTIDGDTVHIVPVVEGADAATAGWIIVGLVVGAAIAIFAMPEIPDNSASDSPSFMFNGSKNVVDQGGAVPILCGICRAGTTVISSGTYAEDFVEPHVAVGAGAGGIGSTTNRKQA